MVYSHNRSMESHALLFYSLSHYVPVNKGESKIIRKACDSIDLLWLRHVKGKGGWEKMRQEIADIGCVASALSHLLPPLTTVPFAH